MGITKRHASGRDRESALEFWTKHPSYPSIPKLYRWCFSSTTGSLHKGPSSSSEVFAQPFAPDRCSVNEGVLVLLRRTFRRLISQMSFPCTPSWYVHTFRPVFLSATLLIWRRSRGWPLETFNVLRGFVAVFLELQ